MARQTRRKIQHAQLKYGCFIEAKRSDQGFNANPFRKELWYLVRHNINKEVQSQNNKIKNKESLWKHSCNKLRENHTIEGFNYETYQSVKRKRIKVWWNWQWKFGAVVTPKRHIYLWCVPLKSKHQRKFYEIYNYV